MLIKKNKAEFINCNLAGFGHSEGYLVLNEMKPGDKLLMFREDENKHDKEAIALFYVPKQQLPEETQLHKVSIEKITDNQIQIEEISALLVGYIPTNHNRLLAMFLDYGHGDIFECRITAIDKDQHPNEQVQIRVNLLKKK